MVICLIDCARIFQVFIHKHVSLSDLDHVLEDWEIVRHNRTVEGQPAFGVIGNGFSVVILCQRLDELLVTIVTCDV